MEIRYRLRNNISSLLGHVIQQGTVSQKIISNEWISFKDNDNIISYPCRYVKDHPELFEMLVCAFKSEETNKEVKSEYIPYQKCPICNGTGIEVNYLDKTRTTIMSKCTLCKGERIIPMYKI